MVGLVKEGLAAMVQGHIRYRGLDRDCLDYRCREVDQQRSDVCRTLSERTLDNLCENNWSQQLGFLVLVGAMNRLFQ